MVTPAALVHRPIGSQSKHIFLTIIIKKRKKKNNPRWISRLPTFVKPDSDRTLSKRVINNLTPPVSQPFALGPPKYNFCLAELFQHEIPFFERC